MSDAVIKVRNIRSGNIKTLHTDRVCVMHEDNITPHLNPNVKRAYPVHGATGANLIETKGQQSGRFLPTHPSFQLKSAGRGNDTT